MTPGAGIFRLFDLSGRVAVVTGSTRGIGRAIAAALLDAGATVVISSEDGADCERVAQEFDPGVARAVAIPCDLADPTSPQKLIADAVARCGRLDILVCNGGVEGPVGPLSEAADEAVGRVLDINLRSAIRLCAAASPHLIGSGAGSIVFISSIAGLRGNAAIGAYGVSKAALAQLARNLAVELGPKGVRANAVSPGLIHTGFAEKLIRDQAFMARRMALTPLRRPGWPEEIAATVLLLASPGGGFITGQNIVVDGGTLITDGN